MAVHLLKGMDMEISLKKCNKCGLDKSPVDFWHKYHVCIACMNKQREERTKAKRPSADHPWRRYPKRKP